MNEKKNNCSSISPWKAYALPKDTKVKTPKRSVTLKYWYGRLGNNFIQIRTALRIAICCKTHLHIEEKLDYFPLLKRDYDFSHLKEGDLVTGLDKSTGCENIQVNWGSGFFYFYGKHLEPKQTSEPSWMIDKKLASLSIDNSCSYDNSALLNWALYDIVSQDGCIDDKNNNKAMGKTCPKYLKDNALVVHMRSGDIFGKVLRSNSLGYKQLPLAFYKNVFLSRPWKTITFVTEMNKDELMNPVWLYYHDKQNRQKNMIFPNATNFKTDLHMMACSQYLIPAASSLYEFIIFFNPNLKEYYTHQNCYNLPTSKKSIICNSYKLNGYVFSNWINSREQREEMISYNINNMERSEIQMTVKNEFFWKL